jgi:hypothetical protein
MRKNTAVLLVLALAVALLLNTKLLPYALSQTQNNTSVSAPAIEWQNKYGGSVLYASNLIQTSDGGFVYWWDGSINKTDSNNNTQWVKTFYYKGFEGMTNNTGPLEELSSVIETSDGALAALGIGLWHLDDGRSGSIYLIKTEAFLPLPSQAPLPTPIPTPLPALTVEDAVIMALIIGVVVVAGLLFYFKKRKH